MSAQPAPVSTSPAALEEGSATASTTAAPAPDPPSSAGGAGAAHTSHAHICSSITPTPEQEQARSSSPALGVSVSTGPRRLCKQGGAHAPAQCSPHKPRPSINSLSMHSWYTTGPNRDLLSGQQSCVGGRAFCQQRCLCAQKKTWSFVTRLGASMPQPIPAWAGTAPVMLATVCT